MNVRKHDMTIPRNVCCIKVFTFIQKNVDPPHIQRFVEKGFFFQFFWFTAYIVQWFTIRKWSCVCF